MPEGNGGLEFDADTVVRARRTPAVDPSDVDADTVIRERAPFADLPPEVRALAAGPVSSAPVPADERPRERVAPQPVPPPARARALGETQPIDYSFRINTHDPIALDKPALIGRRPSLPRVTPGRAPRLVRVPSPQREVSGTHVELRQQGTLVIVTDLRSANGSTVQLPGRDAVRLVGGESLVVIPGTVIDIGDGNLVEILPLERSRVASAAGADPTEGLAT